VKQFIRPNYQGVDSAHFELRCYCIYDIWTHRNLVL